MKKLGDVLKGIAGVLLLAGLAVALAALLSRASITSERGQSSSPIETPPPPTVTRWTKPTPALPTMTPPGYVPIYTGTPPTATPRPSEIRPPAKVSTPTPLPISKTVDLAKGLPDEDKSVYIIQRSNGAYEKFLIPDDYAGDVRLLMGLGPEDVLIYHYPLKPRPYTPLRRTEPVPVSPTEGSLISPLATPTRAPVKP